MYRIAIIGAGPAGTTLARLLLPLSNVEVIVFESETSPNARGQGGTLDLHTNSGLAALKEAGLYEEFLKYARFDGEAMCIADKNLTAFVATSGATEGKSRGRPEIDRKRLREILCASLPDGMIRWASKLQKVGDDHSLHFDHGIETGFDLIVGADGAWSKVRSLLSDIEPHYSGIAGVELGISDAEKRYPELHKLANRGSLFTFSDGKSIMAQQIGDGSIKVSQWSVRPADWKKTCGYDVYDTKAVKSAILASCADWDPRLLAMVEATDDDIPVAPRDIYMLPIGFSWDHKPGVTLIGDSSHLMGPFAGEGVNLAMNDALQLAHAIADAAKSGATSSLLDASVRKFELDMFGRAKPLQEITWGNTVDTFMTPGAPRACIERYLARNIRSELGPVLGPIVTVLVYVYFFFWKLLH